MAVYFENASYTVSEGSNISICILANISSDIPVVVMVTSQQMIGMMLHLLVVVVKFIVCDLISVFFLPLDRLRS